MKAVVLTVSDGVARGERDDRSGDLLAELLGEDGFDVERRVVPDERGTSLRRWSSSRSRHGSS